MHTKQLANQIIFINDKFGGRNQDAERKIAISTRYQEKRAHQGKLTKYFDNNIGTIQAISSHQFKHLLLIVEILTSQLVIKNIKASLLHSLSLM